MHHPIQVEAVQWVVLPTQAQVQLSGLGNELWQRHEVVCISPPVPQQQLLGGGFDDIPLRPVSYDACSLFPKTADP